MNKIRILSWNVNGMRAISKKGFLEWLLRESPDVLCIQETKCHKEQLTDNILKPVGYETYWSSAEKKGYSGVAVYSKLKPNKVDYTLGDSTLDTEGRTLILEYEDFTLFNIYFPNGGAGNKRVPFKMKFYEYFLDLVKKMSNQGKKLVICGDFNTAHQEIDLARPKQNEKNTGFLPEEREWITRFIQAGFVDTFRACNAEPGHYTWWDYKTKARERNVGWRIDYFFISQNLKANLCDAFILDDVNGSDHCPLGVILRK